MARAFWETGKQTNMGFVMNDSKYVSTRGESTEQRLLTNVVAVSQTTLYLNVLKSRFLYYGVICLETLIMPALHGSGSGGDVRAPGHALTTLSFANPRHRKIKNVNKN